jgi:PAS domain S-box-containing protein
MKDERKTKKQLIAEMEDLRRKVADLEALETTFKRTEAALRESEQMARALLNTPSSIAVLLDTEGTVLDATETLAAMMNRELSEVLSSCFWDLFPPETAERRRAHVEQAIESGKPVRIEDHGQDRFYDGVASPVFDDSGNVTRVAILVHDITERVRLGQQNEERRLYLESVLANAPDAIVTLDSHHKLQEWNPGAERLFGYSREEALGQNIDDLVTGSDPATFEEATGYTQQVLAGTNVGPTETVRFTKDGTPVDVVVAGAPILVQGELVGIVAVYTDITSRKQTEAELRTRTAQLVGLREVGLELTAELELDTLLESIVSKAVSMLNGTSGGLFLYRPDLNVLEWTVKVGPHPTPVGTTLKPGEGVSGRAWKLGGHVLVDNYAQWDGRASYTQDSDSMAVVALPVRWRDSFLGVLNVLRTPPETFSQADAELLDLFAAQSAIAIENARLYQQVSHQAGELAKVVKRLQELDRLKSEFIQNVSHELRSPLALIRGYAELLSLGELGELELEHKKPVDIIARRSRMLSDLVGDILLVLEVEANPRDPEPVQLGILAKAAVEDFQLSAQMAGLILESEITDELPPVSAYPTYLRRVVDNLIDNAIKFTPEGGRITVRAHQSEQHVILEVSDTGIGIPYDQLERVFERLYQVSGSAKRRYGGVGLGLALAREIAIAYGGDVTVESELGKGSTFTVSLPIREK